MMKKRVTKSTDRKSKKDGVKDLESVADPKGGNTIHMYDLLVSNVVAPPPVPKTTK